MTWHASEPVTPAADDLLASAPFPNGFPVEVVVALDSEQPFVAILRIKRGDPSLPAAQRIRRSMRISSPGGYFQTPAIPIGLVSSGDILELASRDTLQQEVQGTLFTRQAG